jgi:uncharacterized membrane protein
MKEQKMVQNQTPLPAGAGAVTGTDATKPIANTTPLGQHGSSSAGHGSGAETRQPTSAAGHYATTDTETDYRAPHRELMLAERRSPPTATVVGAVIAGAIAGGAIPFLLAGRASGRATASPARREDTLVVESVVINRPAREIYDFWRNFTNLSRFMENIKSVETLSDIRSHWVIKAPAGTSVEFDSRVVDDVPGRSISWESEEGASVPNRGRVEFIETASGNGTNVRVTMNYDPPAGAAGRVLAKLFAREPSVQAREDLARLKALMEGGPTPA